MTEEQLKVDHGSGKYRLSLTNRKPAGEKGSPIESYDFEIYNPKYPPRLPRAVWKNDPRNRRWEALMPKEEPPAPAAPAVINPLDSFGTFLDIQDRIEERLKPGEATTPPTAPADPFDTAKKIMDMRANDPMITMFMQRLEAADKAAEIARSREFELLKELRQSSAAPAAPAKGLVDQILELATVADKLGPLKALFGGSNGSSNNGSNNGEAPRPARMNALEFWSTVIPKVFDSPIANAVATKVMQSNQQPQAGMNGTQQQAAVHQASPPADAFQRFINDVATPAMLEYFQSEATGEALADWIYSVFPRECLRLQKFTHPQLPGLVGADAIITAYKNTPQVWPKVATKEAEFTAFIREFCAWVPQPDEEVIDAKPAVDEDDWQQGPDREEAQV